MRAADESIDLNLVSVARRAMPASLVIIGGKIVNVFTGEIYDGGIAVFGKHIAVVGDIEGTIGSDTQIIDASGSYLVPGLMDGHNHIESSLLSIEQFAGCALRTGTTSIVTDLHEVAAVGGLKMVRKFLDNIKDYPFNLFFAIPSHVPFTPGYETTGGIVGPEQVSQALEWPESVGLSEVVASSALEKDERLLRSMSIVKQSGGLLHGHSPFITGGDLAGFASMGARTCHESFNHTEAIERLRNGIHLLIRDSSVAHSLPEIIRCYTESGVSSRRISLITDDLLAHDLVYVGYMDEVVRRAIKLGVDPVTAIQMVTLNPAEAYRVDHIVGALAPGRLADIVFIEDLDEFIPKKVISNGELVAIDKNIIVDLSQSKNVDSNSINIKSQLSVPMLEKHLTIKGAKEVSVNILDTPQDMPVPKISVESLKTKDGVVYPDPSNDIALMCVFERHNASGNLSVAFVRGFGLKTGAMASSVAHDHHNLIGIGTSLDDLVVAINRVASLHGGQVIVSKGNVLAELPLPILGLMSDQPYQEVCSHIDELDKASREIGATMSWPLMFLSFLSCSAGPGYALTDKGIYDGFNKRLIDPFA